MERCGPPVREVDDLLDRLVGERERPDVAEVGGGFAGGEREVVVQDLGYVSTGSPSFHVQARRAAGDQHEVEIVREPIHELPDEVTRRSPEPAEAVVEDQEPCVHGIGEP